MSLSYSDAGSCAEFKGLLDGVVAQVAAEISRESQKIREAISKSNDTLLKALEKQHRVTSWSRSCSPRNHGPIAERARKKSSPKSCSGEHHIEGNAPDRVDGRDGRPRPERLTKYQMQKEPESPKTLTSLEVDIVDELLSSRGRAGSVSQNVPPEGPAQDHWLSGLPTGLWNRQISRGSKEAAASHATALRDLSPEANQGGLSTPNIGDRTLTLLEASIADNILQCNQISRGSKSSNSPKKAADSEKPQGTDGDPKALRQISKPGMSPRLQYRKMNSFDSSRSKTSTPSSHSKRTPPHHENKTLISLEANIADQLFNAIVTPSSKQSPRTVLRRQNSRCMRAADKSPRDSVRTGGKPSLPPSFHEPEGQKDDMSNKTAPSPQPSSPKSLLSNGNDLHGWNSEGANNTAKTTSSECSQSPRESTNRDPSPTAADGRGQTPTFSTPEKMRHGMLGDPARSALKIRRTSDSSPSRSPSPMPEPKRRARSMSLPMIFPSLNRGRVQPADSASSALSNSPGQNPDDFNCTATTLNPEEFWLTKVQERGGASMSLSTFRHLYEEQLVQDCGPRGDCRSNTIRSGASNTERSEAADTRNSLPIQLADSEDTASGARVFKLPSDDLARAVAAPFWLRATGLMPWTDASQYSERQGSDHPGRRKQLLLCNIHFGFVALGVLLAICFFAYELIELVLDSKNGDWREGRILCDGRPCVEAWLLCDFAIALGAVASLFAAHKVQHSKILGSRDSLLVMYASNHGLCQRWWSLSRVELVMVLVLWTCMVSERFRSILANVEESISPGLPTLHITAFAFVSGVLLAMAYCLLHICCVLEVMIDSFGIGFVECPDFGEAVRKWNVLQAVLRRVSAIVDVSYLVLLTTAMVAIVAPLMQRHRHAAIPAGFAMGCVARVSFRAGAISYKCDRVPSLINSLFFGQDIDHERQYVVEYIINSMAGFYVMEVRITVEMVLKFAYVSSALTVAVMTKVISV